MRKGVKEFKKRLNIERYYRLGFIVSANYDDFYIEPINILRAKYKYKFLLNNKYTSYCSCEKPCCYRFQYKDTEKYTCGCHNNDTRGISYTYNLFNLSKESITVRVEKPGFCVKMTKY